MAATSASNLQQDVAREGAMHIQSVKGGVTVHAGHVGVKPDTAGRGGTAVKLVDCQARRRCSPCTAASAVRTPPAAQARLRQTVLYQRPRTCCTAPAPRPGSCPRPSAQRRPCPRPCPPPAPSRSAPRGCGREGQAGRAGKWVGIGIRCSTRSEQAVGYEGLSLAQPATASPRAPPAACLRARLPCPSLQACKPTRPSTPDLLKEVVGAQHQLGPQRPQAGQCQQQRGG